MTFTEKLKRFALIAKDRFTGAEVSSVSVMIAYYLLLSLFPLLIAVGNLLPLLGVSVEGIMLFLDTIVPAALLPVLEPIVHGLLTSASGGLLSISILGAIWSSSRGVGYLQRGVNKAYGIPGQSSFISKKLVSLVTIFLVLLLLVAFALIFSFGEMLLESLRATFPWAGTLQRVLLEWKWPVTVIFLFVMLTLVYRVVPDVRLRIRDALPGAAFSTAGLLALVQLFTLYLRFFSFSSYGTLAAFFVLMFWLNFIGMILILGAVLNASISEYRFGKAVEEIGAVDTLLRKLSDRFLAWLKRLFAKKKSNGGP